MECFNQVSQIFTDKVTNGNGLFTATLLNNTIRGCGNKKEEIGESTAYIKHRNIIRARHVTTQLAQHCKFTIISNLKSTLFNAHSYRF
ncbi:MAG: hypothetical protein ACR2IS_18765 [Nitrososphaeraceae archaeon]